MILGNQKRRTVLWLSVFGHVTPSPSLLLPSKIRRRYIYIYLFSLPNLPHEKNRGYTHTHPQRRGEGQKRDYAQILSVETLQTRREWDNTFIILKEKKVLRKNAIPRKAVCISEMKEQ